MTTTKYIKELFSLLVVAIGNLAAVLLRMMSVPFWMGFAVFAATADAANNAVQRIMDQRNAGK